MNSDWRAFCQDSCIESASKESKIALVTTTICGRELEALSVGSGSLNGFYSRYYCIHLLKRRTDEETFAVLAPVEARREVVRVATALAKI